LATRQPGMPAPCEYGPADGLSVASWLTRVAAHHSAYRYSVPGWNCSQAQFGSAAVRRLVDGEDKREGCLAGQWGAGHATGSAVLREPAGAQAYRRDIPEAEVQLLDTGHFALETHVEESGRAIRDFLQAKVNAVVR
jgi:hypothetical protein